jgi:hypothetical protein
VARPLLTPGKPEPQPNMPEALAILSSRVAEAKRLADGGGEVAEVAEEYAQALEALRGALLEVPSLQPLVRAGLDTLRGSLGDSDGMFLLGLLGVGAEVSRQSEYLSRVEGIHARMIACRLRAGAIAIRRAPRPAESPTVTAVFVETDGWNPNQSDTLSLRNVSGERLTNVIVLTELHGASGERFKNLFYVEAWQPDAVLLAIHRSARPTRETVRNVKRVQFMVISDQRASKREEITPTPQG